MSFFNKMFGTVILGIKAKANEIQIGGTPVPGHLKLPDLQEILKMRPTTMRPEPMTNNEENNDDITAFMFVVEHLVGAVIGKKVWDRTKCHHNVSKSLTKSDEAYLYVILYNSYHLWKNAEGTRVGSGSLTKDGSNKKYCGWTKEGILMYNQFMKKVMKN
jgi:hypothetical protein